jgi:hypothetical protein
VALGASAASSCRHCASGLLAGPASRLSSCCCQLREAVPSRRGPVGRGSLGSTWGGGAPYLHVRDQFGWHESVELGRPGRRFTCGVEADLVGELGDQV